MKLVRKTLLGLAALAVVMGLASCKFMSGKGDTDGTKWDLTMKVDGTKIPSTVEPTSEGKGPYRRYWEEFSINEACAEIETTITFNSDKCEYSNGVATAGLIFDLNKSDDGKTVDFNLIGISPSSGYYVERYTSIPKGKAASGDSSDGSLGTYEDLDGKAHSTTYITWGGTGKPSAPTANSDGNYVIKVKITQETPKVYTVYINDVKVSKDTKMSEITPKKTKNLKKNGVEKTYAVGGIACYGSVVKNNKLNVTYHTEKDDVLGTLNAEEIEE